MNKLTKASLLLSTVLLFSCANESKQLEKNTPIKDVNEEVEIPPQAIVNEDTVLTRKDTVLIRKDTLPIVGILKSVKGSDFWGRVYLSLDVNGKLKIFEYYDLVGDGTFNNVEALIGKKVSIKFKTEITLDEIDFHYKGTSIHGEYSRINTENDIKQHSSNKVVGIAKLTEDNISGDLPSGFEIVKDDGSTMYITSFVHEGYLKYSNKKVTVYYIENHKKEVESVVSLEENKLTDTDIFIGKWKKEDSDNPIDPSYFEIIKDDNNGYKVQFSNEEDYYVDAKIDSNTIKGYSNSGNFVIKLSSKSPLIITYSDDGRGHFEPTRNERFVKDNRETKVENTNLKEKVNGPTH